MIILNVQFATNGNYHPADLRGSLLVSNHISWLDVIALNAATPATFVAKSEVRNWPLLGWLCVRVGTLFIKRETARDTVRVNRMISSMLLRGECIALFPEGTSSDSGLPGHFHSSLLQSCVDTKSSLYPVGIRYHDKTGKSNNDAAFVGDMSFIQSLWAILSSPSLHVTLYYLPALAGAESSRRSLAAEAQGLIHMTLVNFSPNHSVCVQSAMPISPNEACPQFSRISA